MKICGVIAEYNPLHNGHVYHLAEARRRSGADAVAVVMSGPFVQRGEPAAADPVTRARWAAAHGADLVLELPAAYACGSAQTFALGGMAMLAAISADTFAFGCETDDLSALKAAAACLAEEPPAFTKALRRALDAGASFPRARAEALGAVLGRETAEAAALPNNILALEYLQAEHSLGGGPEPIAIRRQGRGYRDETPDECPSAAAVRATWAAEAPLTGVPDDVAEALAATRPVGEEDLWKLIRWAWLSADPESLASLPDMGEGLHLRILDAMKQSPSADDLLQAVLTRRYTAPRIRRALLHEALGLTQMDALMLRRKRPLFLRPLALGEKGAEVLSALKARCPDPLITNAARFTPADPAQERLWALNRRAWTLYSTAAGRTANEDLTVRLNGPKARKGEPHE